jgi:succinate-semialdehyde dehydrogenase/glutarate-semialdehyde dehydrogenase
LRRIAEIMRRDVADFALTMTLEQGKPLEQARAEVLATADQFDWNADEARRVYGRIVSSKTGSDQIFVYSEPIGPVATFAPWNFPSLLPGRKISAALAAGCAVLVVPAIEAPLSALLIARAALEAGIPPGALTIVLGDPALLSETIISDSRIRKVSVTSSVPVGQIVMGIAAKTITPVTLELGGHSPVIVTEGVDVAAVAALCSAGKFRNAGQVCISASRFFVAEPIYEEFVAHFVAHTKNLKIGPGTDPASDVGPLSTSRRLAAIDAMVADARQSGAEIAFGGKKLSSFSDGYFYEPTVVLQPDDSTVVMREETFGPIAPISSYSSLDEAVGRANSTPYGLAGFIFSEDIGNSLALARRLEVGMVGINNLTIATAEAPFGGVKMSGFGREGGLEGVSDYTVTKYVNVRQPARSDHGK